MNVRPRTATLGLLLSLCLPHVALAQRELHWDRLEVDAHLDSTGRLQVTETHAMVFSGDWNGGERTFNIRPQQTLSFIGISRAYDGELRNLSAEGRLLRVDDYAWTDGRTLRWRSRLPTDPPFARTPITYVVRYQLSGILVKAADRYRLDHDFAFPDRPGTIGSFILRLTLDPAWQPLSEVRQAYMASGMEPGRQFVLTIPLRYTGTGRPVSREGPSLFAIAIAASILLGVTALAVVAFFAREQSYGRFAPVTTDQIDEAWIAEHILTHPAEVVGAAWDDSIGTPEVVALLARMVSEGTLESEVADRGAGKKSMRLRLKVDRSTLDGYERTLVDALFFDRRTETSTEDVMAHYRDRGFDPAKAIQEELDRRVRLLLEAGDPTGRISVIGLVWVLLCAGLLGAAWLRGDTGGSVALFVGVGALVVAGVARAAGVLFRARMDWGRRAAVLCLLPALTVAAATATFLWLGVGRGTVDLSLLMMSAIVGLSLWLAYTSIQGMKSRPSRAAIALRKKLTAGREFFKAQLREPQQRLRADWYPWVLAFGLGEQADAWSAQHVSTEPDTDTDTDNNPMRSGRDVPSGHPALPARDGWTGFGGGRSGGAGASAGWSMAAAGMAAPMAAPTSSSSGSSSDGSSSSSGSSGGGGGGGW